MVHDFGSSHNDVNRFLDIEATVGEGEDEGEDDEEGNGDDGFIEDEPADNPYYTPLRQMDQTSNHEGGWHDYVASLEERYASGSTSKATHHIVEDNCRNEPGPLMIDPVVVSCIENITTHDYPFWRIRCRPDSAKALVDFLHEMATPRHEMRTAFVHGSTKFWVYLEATMNDHLRHLVKRAPGVVHHQSGFISERVDFNGGLTLLKMQHVSPPEIGKWVQVRKGIYKGDMGCVMSTRSGGVELLLIPRLSQPHAPKGNPRSAPTLFDCEIVKRLDNIEPVRIQEHIYSFRGDRFEHGLIIKSYASSLVSTTVSCMPLELLRLFQECGHPKVMASRSSIPKPLEWHFAEGDTVSYAVDLDHGSYDKSGVISTLRSDAVELSTEEGIISVPWLQIRKVLHQGDFVEVTGGMYLGWTGWVGGLHELVGTIDDDGDYTRIVGQVATIIKIEDKDKALSERTQMFDVSVNLLKPATVPHVLGMHPQHESAIGRPERVPWLNTEIIVIKDGHVSRTLKGIVKDVLCNQLTPSELRVVVQMNSLMAFPSITLDYDGVVEASCGIKLHDYAPPKSELFIPRNKTSGPSKSYHASIQPPFVCSPSPGNATPIPEPSLVSTPAWDPSSRTPQPNSENTEFFPSPDPPPNPSSPTPQSNTESLPSPKPFDQEHILLDLRLLGAQLRVFVTGGKFDHKELTASVRFEDGRLSIQREVYHSFQTLLPNWVAPKHPSPTRDNGLLVVVKGDHCGKYVRRIHHRYKGEEAIVILAVVNRVAGQVDNLPGEQLELGASHLCVCEESKEDKRLNRSLMNPLREEARKIRAK